MQQKQSESIFRKDGARFEAFKKLQEQVEIKLYNGYTREQALEDGIIIKQEDKRIYDNQNKTDDEAQLFMKRAQQRMQTVKRLKGEIECKCEMLKGKGREIKFHSQKKLKLYKNLEDKFKDHSETFRTRFIDNRFNHQNQFHNIITEVSDVCEDIVHSISKIKKEDRKKNREIRKMFKKMDDNSEINFSKWQTERNYLKIKDELIKMQQDEQLPDYCKFCLINSKEALKRMNRSNQEVKDTRLLFKLQNQFTPEQLKKNMEKLLKKYQRIQQNQELKRDGAGWQLITNKQPYDSTEDYQLIKQHMIEKKEPTITDKINNAQKIYKKELKDQKYRDEVYKQLKKQNEAITKYEKRIFKTETDENIEQLFDSRLKEAKSFHEQQTKKLHDIKQEFQQKIQTIKSEHSRLYKHEHNFPTRLLQM